MSECIYDLETKFLLREVGNRYESLGFLCGVIWDKDRETVSFYKDATSMLTALLTYDKIISFNGLKFDNLVLAGICCDYIENATDIELTFGKHKGQKIKDIPTDYIKWLVNNNPGALEKVLNSIRMNVGIEEKSQHNLRSDIDILQELNSKSIDIFDSIKTHTNLEYPVNFDDLCLSTINEGKTKDITNENIPMLYQTKKENAWPEIMIYVSQEIKIFIRLYHFIKTYGYVLIPQIKKWNNIKI